MIRRGLRPLVLITVVCVMAAVIGSQNGQTHHGMPSVGVLARQDAPQVVPEPEPWMIFASSLLPAIAFAWRKRRK